MSRAHCPLAPCTARCAAPLVSRSRPTCRASASCSPDTCGPDQPLLVCGGGQEQNRAAGSMQSAGTRDAGLARSRTHIHLNSAAAGGLAARNPTAACGACTRAAQPRRRQTACAAQPRRRQTTKRGEKGAHCSTAFTSPSTPPPPPTMRLGQLASSIAFERTN